MCRSIYFFFHILPSEEIIRQAMLNKALVRLFIYASHMQHNKMSRAEYSVAIVIYAASNHLLEYIILATRLLSQTGILQAAPLLVESNVFEPRPL